MGNKAQTAGILTIISGGIGIIWSLIAFSIVPTMRSILEDPTYSDPNLTQAELDMLRDFTTGFVVFWGIFLLLLSVFAIIAGTYALKRKAWGLGLAGSIISVFLFLPTAVAAIIFMALAKPEFGSRAQVGVVPPVPATVGPGASTPPPAEPLVPPQA